MSIPRFSIPVQDFNSQKEFELFTYLKENLAPSITSIPFRFTFSSKEYPHYDLFNELVEEAGFIILPFEIVGHRTSLGKHYRIEKMINLSQGQLFSEVERLKEIANLCRLEFFEIEPMHG